MRLDCRRVLELFSHADEIMGSTLCLFEKEARASCTNIYFCLAWDQELCDVLVGFNPAVLPKPTPDGWHSARPGGLS